MEGKAYTPKSFDPDTHERFMAPSPEVMEFYKKDFYAHRERLPKRLTYDEIQEWRKRGESHALGHYAYEMMYDIYAGIEDDLMDGAIDTHLHIFPDYVPRSIDIIELAIEASKAKMRAIVCKDHFFTNVGQAWAAQWVVEDMVRKGELEHGCKVFGTHNLAFSHHPDQIRLLAKYPNVGGVYFYTMTGRGQAGPDLFIADDNGELLSDVKECIEAAAENRICIFTGHKKPNDVMAIVKYCHEVDARVLVTHAGGAAVPSAMAGTIEQAKEMASLGAFLEINANKFFPSLIWPLLDPNGPLDYVKEVGAENVIANTDFGQVLVGDPVEGFKLFIRGMLHYGISKEDIKTMVQTNPAKLLYLDD